ncbi:MAG: TonB-dependent receptor [Rhodothermales bacterium]
MLFAGTAWAQTGKIAGIVTSAATGEALPGVNVVIDGTTQGAVTDLSGYYVILNVRPGTYNIRASFVGFTPQVSENIRVNIDLTTELNFGLREEAVGLDEVVVSAERPVVQRDVSSSLVNISSEEIENLPVASVADVIGLQAGFEPGLNIRGSGGDQVAMVVDGVNFADPRGNQPFLGVSYTSMEEVQVMTGGFNAEYGNVRSGLINVVTKDPGRTRYFADAIFRYTSAQEKYSGASPGDLNTFYKYPRFSQDVYPDANGDPCTVSMCGTSILPQYLARQYEPFGGWITLSQGTGWTPEQMRVAQEWYYRKDFKIEKPDYEADATIGGPVPGGTSLGNLRFTASFRQTQTAYNVSQQRPTQDLRTFQGKVISDVGKGMRLVLSGMHSLEQGFALDNFTAQFLTAESPQYPWDGRGYLYANQGNGYANNGLYGDWTYSPSDITRQILGAEFTHTLNASTFYTVQLQRNSSSTLTGEPDRRPTSPDGQSAIANCVTPGLQLRQASSCAADEIPVTYAPFGFRELYETSVFGTYGAQGGDARDSTDVLRWSGRFDLTSQLNRFMLVKTGVEFLYSDYDVYHGSWDPANPHQENQKIRWSRSPVQGALYAQTKLEFRGMIANLGLRADYFHATGEWYDYAPFDRAFSALFGFEELDVVLDTAPTARQLTLSPRLGISFPVTETSKFYFNYGHFRQMLDPARLFGIEYRINGQINNIGNPNQTLPKTVAYELGYEQGFADQFLIRVAGFYRDLSKQPRNVTYISLDDLVNYSRVEPLNFADNRGFEITLSKNRGRWLRGFINYSYLVKKGGNFGYGQIDENRRAFQEYINSPSSLSSSTPVPEPFARVNLEFLLPANVSQNETVNALLGDWRINLLGDWRTGAPSTWDGGLNVNVNGPGQDLRIAYNVNWRDYKMLDLRLAKNIGTSFGRAQLFVDITNVLNLKQMYYRNGNIFVGTDDARDYMRSLHLDGSIFDPIVTCSTGADEGNCAYNEKQNLPYLWVPGNDKPGDFRKNGVAFDPIFVDANVQDGVTESYEGALYYDVATASYMTLQNGTFVPADENRVKQVLDDKAYIDMPNNLRLFLNPRNVYFGVRLSF